MVNQIVTPYDEAVSDFDAAFIRLKNSSGEKDEQRRAWLEAVNHTYRIREHRKSACATYKSVVDTTESGKVTDGIIVVRNIATHVLTQRANPESKMLYPSNKLFPSEYLFPGGGNLFWLDMHELSSSAAAEVCNRDKKNYYRDKVAGLLVLDTLVSVRQFLIEKSW